MGMDVYGKKPKNEAGKYFRNNVWWWHPLADYIIEQHPDLAAGCEYWHSNDGGGLNARKAVKLADAWTPIWSPGRWRSMPWSMPRRWPLCLARSAPCAPVRAFAPMRSACSTATTSRGIRRRVAAGATGARGIGTRDPWAASYPFDVDNVREFATFVRASGGFEIW